MSWTSGEVHWTYVTAIACRKASFCRELQMTKIGYKSPYRHLDRLTRVYEYMGPAWYQREIEIPVAWKGKRIFLYFERTHWLSSVYVGKEEVSKIDYISIPHNHELTQWLHPGKKN